MAASPSWRTIAGLFCAGSVALATSPPSGCGGGGVCPAAGEEPLDEFSALQTARQRRSRNTTRGTTPRGRPFMGAGRGEELDADQHGALIINEDGVDNKYYLPGAETVDGGKTVKYTPPWRFYLMKEPTTDYSDASKFYKPILPGKTFTVDMKLENVGCGCNLNFYLVDMPVRDAGKDHDHYCDGQCFSGLGCCAEFDMNEGNSQVQQITNHACSRNYAGIGHGDWQCHKWGDPEVKVSPWEFSAGRGTIDGNKPFTFSQEFRMTGDQLTVITTISQGSKSVSKTMGPNAELQHMLKYGSLLRGMAFVTGYWTDQSMNWLDGETCGSGAEHCSGAPAYISNWRITTNSEAPPAPPQPQPSGHGGGGDRCCYGSVSSCKSAGDWCSQSAENCEGACKGKMKKVEPKCCYGSEYNCKEPGNWCNEASSNCEGKCQGTWMEALS